MSSWVKIAAIVIIVLIAGALFVKLYVFREAKTSVDNQKADVEIEASTLVGKFEADENAATSQYMNKVVLISGIIDKVDVNNDVISVYVKQKEDISGVLCSFDKTVISANELKPGDHVKIKGICNGYLMDVVLNKCALVK